jgi:hypothetical protein
MVVSRRLVELREAGKRAEAEKLLRDTLTYFEKQRCEDGVGSLSERIRRSLRRKSSTSRVHWPLTRRDCELMDYLSSWRKRDDLCPEIGIDERGPVIVARAGNCPEAFLLGERLIQV